MSSLHHNSNDKSSATLTYLGLSEKRKTNEEGKKRCKKKKYTRDTPGELKDDDYHLLNDRMVDIIDETRQKID